MFEGPATGFDDDALDILKAFSVDEGPDVYVAAHEWVGEFAKSGYAMDMTDFIAANQWAFGDVIPVLWNATKYDGKSLRHPAGHRDPHVLLQQGHAAEDRQGRGLHRGASRRRSTRASSP